MIGRRQGRQTLESMSQIAAATPFTEIVRALAILDNPPPDWAAIDECVAEMAKAPDYLWHLIPWHSADALPDRLPEGYGKQEAISLRLLRRPDLSGQLVRRAHISGLKSSGGKAFLIDVSGDARPRDGFAICLIDGAEVSSLGDHIAGYNVSPKAYREFFGLGC